MRGERLWIVDCRLPIAYPPFSLFLFPFPFFCLLFSFSPFLLFSPNGQFSALDANAVYHHVAGEVRLCAGGKGEIARYAGQGEPEYGR